MKLTCLGFDLGTHLGWAVATDSLVVSGHTNLLLTKQKKMTPGVEGKRFLAFRSELHTLFVKFHPDIIAIERPIGGPAQGGASAALFYGMRSICLMKASEANVPFFEVPTNTLKKFATGSGSNGVGKDLMIAAAVRVIGREIEDHNEADAIHVARWGRSPERK